MLEGSEEFSIAEIDKVERSQQGVENGNHRARGGGVCRHRMPCSWTRLPLMTQRKKICH